MSLLQVNSDDLPDGPRLRAALERLPPGAPVVVMIHGFKFAPGSSSDPHRHILSLEPRRDCWKSVSWPRHLGLAGGGGLAIGFGWPARGSIWRAWRASARAGRRLSRLLTMLREVAPERPIHLVGHSLGARVALLALPGLPERTVGRIILISAAVFRTEATRLAVSPAGCSAEIFNVTGRENTLFDLLLRLAMPLGGRTLGQGGPSGRNWLDLPLDRSGPLLALRGLGYRISAPRARICHWSGYLRPGVWRLYRALLLTPARTPLPLLRNRLVADRERESAWRLAALRRA
ncbi:DUF726 domain-containing protein [Histidinibacterium aquaticum]|nr:DUF726 domain-containing protein [Histidinibacterium aquaticum]